MIARRVLYAVGTLVAAYGCYGLLTDSHSDPWAWARFAATVVIANDGFLAPLVIVGGLLLARLSPRPARAYVQSGALISGAVILVALPALLGLGRTGDNPSLLPLNYAHGLLTVLAVVWTGIGTLALARWLAARRHAHPDRTG